MNQAQVVEIVNAWVPLLGLTHWKIDIVWGKEAEEYFKEKTSHTFASVWRARDYEEAKFFVNPDTYKDWTIFDTNQRVVHELLHLVTRDIEFVLNQIDGLLHRDVDAVISETFTHHLEGAIDRLAYRFVEIAGVQ